MPNGTPPPATPVPPDASEGGRNRVLMVVLMLLALAAVAVGGYVVGKADADADGAERRGEREGRAAEAATYRPGTPKYQTIYNRGLAAGRAEGTRIGRRQGEREGAERGRRVGLERGERVGELEGEREGVESGARAALGGLEDWDVGSFYIVRVGTGTGGVPYAIRQRREMTEDDRYAVCADNPAFICTEPVGGG